MSLNNFTSTFIPLTLNGFNNIQSDNTNTTTLTADQVIISGTVQPQLSFPTSQYNYTNFNGTYILQYNSATNVFTATGSLINFLINTQFNSLAFTGYINGIDTTTFGYLSGATSNIQTQINSINTSLSNVALLNASNIFTGATNRFQNIQIDNSKFLNFYDTTNTNYFSLSTTSGPTLTLGYNGSSKATFDTNGKLSGVPYLADNNTFTNTNTFSNLVLSGTVFPNVTTTPIIISQYSNTSTAGTYMMISSSASSSGFQIVNVGNSVNYFSVYPTGTTTSIPFTSSSTIQGLSSTIFSYLNSISSNVQTQINNINTTLSGVPLLSANNVFTGTTNQFNSVSSTILTFSTSINGFSTTAFSNIMNILTSSNTWSNVNAHTNYIQMSSGNKIYFNNPVNNQSMSLYTNSSNNLQIANQSGTTVVGINQNGDTSINSLGIGNSNTTMKFQTTQGKWTTSNTSYFSTLADWTSNWSVFSSNSGTRAYSLGIGFDNGNNPWIVGLSPSVSWLPINFLGIGYNFYSYSDQANPTMSLNNSGNLSLAGGLNVVGNTTLNSTLTASVGNTILTLSNNSNNRLFFTDEYGPNSVGPGMYGNAGYGLTLAAAGPLKFFPSVVGPPTGYAGTPGMTLSSSGLTLQNGPVNQALPYIMSSSGNGGILSFAEFQFHQLYSLVTSIFPSTMFINAFTKNQNSSSFMLFGDFTYYATAVGGYLTNFTFDNNTTGFSVTVSQYFFFNLSSVHTSAPFCIEFSSTNPNGLLPAGVYTLTISRTSVSQVTDGNDRVRIMYKISNQ